MAKVTYNGTLKAIRGRIDRLVFRQEGERATVRGTARPRRTPPSAAEAAQVSRFTSAALSVQAAEPEAIARYKAAARARHVPVYAVAVGDHLNPPVIDAIDLSAYRGAAVQVIRIRAHDDFEVRAVHVMLKLPDGAELESGAATHLKGDMWIYETTANAPAWTEVTITATASDWARNVTTRDTLWPEPRE